jgi:hypothetical protein
LHSHRSRFQTVHDQGTKYGNTTQHNTTQHNTTQHNTTQLNSNNRANLEWHAQFKVCRPLLCRFIRWWSAEVGTPALICFLLIAAASRIATPLPAAEYYVSAASGINAAGGGQITAPWKTIQYALNRVNSGDIVYVQTGIYGYGNDVASGSSSAEWDRNGIKIMDNNVQLIGYLNHPNDLNNGEGVPPNYQTIAGYASMMPIIQGINRPINTGITVENSVGGQVAIQNFRVQDFWIGVHLKPQTQTCYVKNVVGLRFGDVYHDYSGIGFDIQGSGHGIENCVVLNACAEGYAIHASNCLVTNCKAYCDDNSTSRNSAMDYYFLICASSSAVPASGNTLRNCVCERRLDPNNGSIPGHEGHGFTIQAYASTSQMAVNNTIEDCTIKSLAEPFLLRERGASGRFLRCTSDYTATIAIPEAGGGRITIYSSKNNVFSRIYLKNAKIAVLLGGYSDETDVSVFASENNIFENCIFDGCERGIELSWYESDQLEVNPTDAEPNQVVVQTQFLNCTFVAHPSQTSYFLWSNREVFANFNNKIFNCIIKDFDSYVSGTPSSDWKQFIAVSQIPSPPDLTKIYVSPGDYRDQKYTRYTLYPTPGWSISNCCFWPTAFASGSGNKLANPAFATGLYELSSSSPCVNAGTSVQFQYPGDYDGSQRIQNIAIDIGAQESSSAFVP